MKKRIIGIALFACVVAVVALLNIVRAPVCGDNTGIALDISSADRSQILSLFRNHSVFRRGNLIILYIHRDELKNAFYFEEKQMEAHVTLEFLRDSLEYQVTLNVEVVDTVTVREENKKDVMIAYVSKLVSKMKSYQIRGVSAEFCRLGIDLEIYFQDWSRLIYVSNLAKIKNAQRMALLSNDKNIEDGWYYHCE